MIISNSFEGLLIGSCEGLTDWGMEGEEFRRPRRHWCTASDWWDGSPECEGGAGIVFR